MTMCVEMDKDGGNTMPCEDCKRMLLLFGIRRVQYTTTTQGMHYQRTKDLPSRPTCSVRQLNCI